MALNGFGDSVSWSDFNPVLERPARQNEDAAINVRYNYNYQIERNRNAVSIANADINIIMLFSACWAVSSQMTNDLLRHEQGHYDITSLGAREFYHALLHLSAVSEHMLRTSISQLNQRVQLRINRANARYDGRTDHSRNTGVQQTWDQAITVALQSPAGSIDQLPS